MVQDAIAKGNDLWTKFRAGGWGAFTIMDILWLALAAALLIVAIKVVSKVIKVVLIVVCIALVAGYVLTKGFFPVFW